MSTNNDFTFEKKSQFPLLIGNNREEDPKLLQAVEALLHYRRGWISKVPRGEGVVMLMSGGLDTAVTMDLVLSDEYGFGVSKIYPIFVRRSARATPYEEKAAKFFVDFYGKRYPGKMGNLEIVETEVPPLQLKKYPEVNRLSTKGHPMRNGVLQSIGVQYMNKIRATEDLKVSTVLTCTVGDDSFPHSSLLAIRTTNLLACEDMGDWSVLITSPLVDTQFDGRPLFKKDLIKHAMEKSIPLEYSRSCIEGGELSDGKCPECLGRLRAFDQAGFKDPAVYSE